MANNKTGARDIAFGSDSSYQRAPSLEYIIETRMRMRYSLPALVALLLYLTGCGTTRPSMAPHVSPVGVMLSSSPYSELKAAIDALIPATLFPPANLGIKVVSLASGETLYELNPDHLFNPASNQKLFTSAVALIDLGPGYRFCTTVSFDTSQVPTITVRGSGDPMLTANDLDSLAALLVSVLPPDTQWILLGDASLFDDLPFGAGWAWDGEPYTYSMPISPLSVNGNSITVVVDAGVATGEVPRITIDPQTEYVTFTNAATTSDDTTLQRLSVRRRWRQRLNHVDVVGAIQTSDSGREYSLSVAGPERYFLTLFAEKLSALGVVIDSVGLVDSAAYSPFRVEFCRTLDTIVTYLNKVSDNLSAENVLKVLGAERRGIPGTAEGGISVLHQQLSAMGVDTSKIVAADGSGLSRFNLTSASSIVTLLGAMHRSGVVAEFVHSLPIAGRDGTLENRMRGTAAEGNLRAKTGTISGASSLSGFVVTADDETLAFAILMQHYPTNARSYRNVQDALGVFLSGFRRNEFGATSKGQKPP